MDPDSYKCATVAESERGERYPQRVREGEVDLSTLGNIPQSWNEIDCTNTSYSNAPTFFPVERTTLQKVWSRLTPYQSVATPVMQSSSNEKTNGFSPLRWFFQPNEIVYGTWWRIQLLDGAVWSEARLLLKEVEYSAISWATNEMSEDLLLQALFLLLKDIQCGPLNGSGVFVRQILNQKVGWTIIRIVLLSKHYNFVITEVPAYSDTLRTWEKCHCNQIVTVSRGILVSSQSFGTCSKCHCKRCVTVNSVTVSGEICTEENVKTFLQLPLLLA